MTDEAMTEYGTPVSIEYILTLDPEPALRCPGIGDRDIPCERTLHVRARDSDLVAPHFAGHHVDGCNRSSKRSDDEPGDAGHTVLQGPRADRWQLALEDPEPSVGPDGRHRPNQTVDGTATRRHRADPTRAAANTSNVRSLSSILAAALTDSLPNELALSGRKYRPTGEVVLPVADATPDCFAAGAVVVWGTITGTRLTRLGGTMLLLDSAADHLAVLIPKEFRGFFPLASDREFIGRTVMTIGTPSGETGKQYLRIPSERSITFDPGVRLRTAPRPASSS